MIGRYGLEYLLLAPIMALLLACSGPEHEAKQQAREKIRLCRADLENPAIDASAKEVVVKPVCERFVREFKERFGVDP